ncbi:dihydrofolate reductase family protein [Georgenia satyanarayanai]|uniref:dihydrofolate reductase family protein n=1 Tax=Georgenia satyanarayanai TaxID=860221 RepID=UPI0012648D47|nr:dihydrofolate reductase family protein [Georgenia satyanarayanai]
MGSLLYVPLCSLDGYVADPAGDHDWAEPSPDVFAFLNELQERIGTEIYGRRTYEVMEVWETDPSLAASGEHERAFADWWQRVEKVVFSTTLTAAPTQRTRLEPRFDADLVRRLKEESTADLSIFGPTIAGAAFEAGLVDEVHMVVSPGTLGGGLRALPPMALRLELLEDRRFTDGSVYLRYAVER